MSKLRAAFARWQLNVVARLLLLLLVLSPLCFVPVPAVAAAASVSGTAHVFLIAGQSNSVGYNSDPLTAEDAIDPRILQLSCCLNGTVQLPPARCFLNVSSEPLLPCSGGRVSFGRSFARALLSSQHAQPQDVVLLVPTGIAGTGFGDGVWTAWTGSGFKPAVASLRRAWELLADSGYTRRFSGVLWMQGSYDAGDNAQHASLNSSAYLQQLLPLVAALRNVSFLPFSSPRLPFLAGQMLPSWMDNVTHPERQGVKIALSQLPQFVAYTGAVATGGLLGDPVYLSGVDHEVIHFTARSQRILGRRYFAAYEAAMRNYAEVEKAELTLLD